MILRGLRSRSPLGSQEPRAGVRAATRVARESDDQRARRRRRALRARPQLAEPAVRRRASRPAQRKRMREFYNAWRTRLRELDFDKLSQEGKGRLRPARQLPQAPARAARPRRTSSAPRRRRCCRSPIGCSRCRTRVATSSRSILARWRARSPTITKQVDSLRALFEPPAGRGGAGAPRQTDARVVRAARRAARLAHRRESRRRRLDQLRGVVANWYRYYDGYDPMFSWWVRDPYRKLDDLVARVRYARTLRERVGRRSCGGAAAERRGVAAERPKRTSRSSATRSAPTGSRPISTSR